MIGLKDFAYNEKIQVNAYYKGDFSIYYKKIEKEGEDTFFIIDFTNDKIGTKQYLLKSKEDNDLENAINIAMVDIDQFFEFYKKQHKKEKSRYMMNNKLVKNFSMKL